MQLIALDGQKRIHANFAAKRSIYLCPECFNPLRVRSGPHRQAHFYHPSKNPLCYQNGKSLFHLNTQLAIAKQLPPKEAELEVAFPEIGRIADVVWEAKKILFEVQCSPISSEEVAKRTTDYRSLGYTVIWILHDKCFNRRTLSPAEAFLLEQDVYYSSYDEQEAGVIYDQFSLVRNHRRLFKGTKLPLSLSSLYSIKEISLLSEWPRAAQRNAQIKRMGFQGDLLDRIRSSIPSDWESMKRTETFFLDSPASTRSWKTPFTWLKEFYLCFLHAVLEIYS
jgi:competence protein CoiA